MHNADVDRAAAERQFLSRGVSRETLDRLRRFAELLLLESSVQNLIARSTQETLWSRHFLDSAQLLDHVQPGGRSWLDIGSGAGLPGLVIGVLSSFEVTLVEPRKRRVEFLERVIQELELADRVQVWATKVERVPHRSYDVVSARAVASLETLFEIAEHLSGPTTRWILPKGRSAQDELETAQRTWHGQFRTVPSATDRDAAIVVADQVRRKRG